MDDEAAVEKRIEIFSDTQNMLRINERLKNLTASAVDKSRLYNDDYVFLGTGFYEEPCKVSVVNERTLISAERLKEKYNRVAVLDFACATNPGGGVVTGSAGQEESLCMCTNLYPCLYQEKFWDSFYGFYKKLESPYHGNKIIFSPGVTVFKEETEFPEPMENWFDVDVITSAAPDIGWVKKYDEDEIRKVLKKRIEAVLNVARDNKEEAVVLGAFGCGKFLNSPEMVADAFHNVIDDEYLHCFKEIVFAVYGKEGVDLENYKVFNKIFDK